LRERVTVFVLVGRIVTEDELRVGEGNEAVSLAVAAGEMESDGLGDCETEVVGSVEEVLETVVEPSEVGELLATGERDADSPADRDALVGEYVSVVVTSRVVDGV
jgi:hypothetical protein